MHAPPSLPAPVPCTPLPPRARAVWSARSLSRTPTPPSPTSPLPQEEGGTGKVKGKAAVAEGAGPSLQDSGRPRRQISTKPSQGGRR